MIDDGMLSTLAEAAELGAALGGTYLRVTWDRDTHPDGSFLSAVDADGAWPEFRFGRLVAVTFWRVMTDDGDRVVRHLERHETRAGVGVIFHGLYEGTRENLGRVVPLTVETVGPAMLNELADGNMISTETPGLAVVYVPNQRPQRRWRHDPIGKNLGRSDLDGVEGLMDALDETYTSWMRDVRLGKARLLIPDSMLESLGPGNGAAWDADREVYVGLNALITGGQTSGLPVEAQQFAIRWAEHQNTARDLVEQHLRTSGYSTQTFGMDEGTRGTTTATEIIARQQRSYMTRDRKVRLWRPAIADLIEKMLAVDAVLFASGVEAVRPAVAFPDGVQDSPLVLAQTAQALRTAEAASTETIVRMVHPDWDDQQITAEVAEIVKEAAAANPPMADPFGNPHAGPALDPSVTRGQ
jgi:A118 family predicted phage portal protein